VDLVRAVAIFLVILLHVAIQPVTIPLESQQTAWVAFDVYNSIARASVPLFVMLSGYLLLQPSKVDEPLRTFFKKRWVRVGLPFVFWWLVYFVWVLIFDNGALGFQSITQSLLQGPYVTFWFIYMLAGLYLLTPLLRVFTAHASDSVMKFTLILWLVPLLGLAGFGLNANLFVLPGWVGYYLLGAYLPKLKPVRKWKLAVLMIVGVVWTLVASVLIVLFQAGSQYFFFDYLTADVIVSSAAMFLLLTGVPSKSVQGTSLPKKLIRIISVNTLPLYLLHTILLEAFQKGLFGFKLTILTLNPFIMTPLLAVLLLFLSLAIIVPLKRVPVLKRLIG
jgi:surface polysaccharide O-acyltransferase-like enzyme